nr:DUF4345 domain-containing protein [Tropicibacter sp. R16_0]
MLGAVGLVPIALSYGLMPQTTVTWLFGFPVEGTNQTHIFRAIMGLYLANAAFWLFAVFRPGLRRTGLWIMVLFMVGLAAGRVLSIVVDGMPGIVLWAYLGAEVIFALLAINCLKQTEKPS